VNQSARYPGRDERSRNGHRMRSARCNRTGIRSERVLEETNQEVARACSRFLRTPLAQQRRSPGGPRFVFVDRLPGKDRFARTPHDQPGRDFARCRAVDTTAVYIPIAGCRFGVAVIAPGHRRLPGKPLLSRDRTRNSRSARRPHPHGLDYWFE